ncbi:tetratricopeptide repeat protein [Sphingomicrobium aestuariivivum]|uniref:tetratricopeptide repeat protein n=1 Tax=Sphingomicrobium aestuariivivum TaxID=1582356 RepID=UPI001FD68C2B|nr:tetratricopeptide repeat protein [Sphingomicrobium aestuariivivum]MCJ8190993.1 tetratricopeptide repeat protein [Sphingomicrobium aestuariivivum]
MSLSLLALALLAQDAPPSVAMPGELLVCGTDDSMESRECRAQLAMKDGRQADAAAEFMAIAGEATDLRSAGQAYAAAATLYNVAKDYERAHEAAAAAAATNSLEPMQLGWVLVDQAWALHELGRLEESNAALASAGQLVQDDPFYWLAAAEMAGQSGDYATALTRIGQAEQRAPDSPEVLFTKGEVLMASGDEAGAKAAWQAAILAMPDHPAAQIANERLQALEPLAPTPDVPPEEPAR